MKAKQELSHKKSVENLKIGLEILLEIFENSYDSFHDGISFEDVNDVARLVTSLYGIAKRADVIKQELQELEDNEIEDIVSEFSNELKAILILIKERCED